MSWASSCGKSSSGRHRWGRMAMGATSLSQHSPAANIHSTMVGGLARWPMPLV